MNCLVGCVCFLLTPHLLVDGFLVISGQFLQGGLEVKDLVLDLLELGLSVLELGVGLFQGPPLGLHITVNLVKFDDVDDPRTETRGCARLGADEIRIELFVLKDGTQMENLICFGFWLKIEGVIESNEKS